jgi:hypothetical protein
VTLKLSILLFDAPDQWQFSFSYCVPLQWLTPVQFGSTLHRLIYMILAYAYANLFGTKALFTMVLMWSQFSQLDSHMSKTWVFSCAVHLRQWGFFQKMLTVWILHRRMEMSEESKTICRNIITYKRRSQNS